jgi:hypothetical protein
VAFKQASAHECLLELHEVEVEKQKAESSACSRSRAEWHNMVVVHKYYSILVMELEGNADFNAAQSNHLGHFHLYQYQLVSSQVN